MAEILRYPKRLIEVDLPIRRISEHARREKRTGHISNLHIWWARRPLAACRSVICATLWPDPADEDCPPAFVVAAQDAMRSWAADHLGLCSPESYKRFQRLQKDPAVLTSAAELREALLDFIADFADWSHSTDEAFLETSRHLTQVAHRALHGADALKPLVVDPFAGGGSIPLEALRVGADAFASDLNPVPVLLNKVILDYAPRYGSDLASDLRIWAEWLHQQAEVRLKHLYPQDIDGSPAVYLWARTIRCEGPGCGAQVPVIRSLWIDQSRGRSVALQLIADSKTKRIRPQLVTDAAASAVGRGTSRRSSVTCPCCNYTTPRRSVEAQAKSAGLGQLLLAVAVDTPNGRQYRRPLQSDIDGCEAADKLLQDLELAALLPVEPLPYLRSIFNVHVYGMQTWRAVFSPRQLAYLATLVQLVRSLDSTVLQLEESRAVAVRTLLALVVSKAAMLSCSLARWRGDKGRLEGAFAMQALPMVWDWAEINPFSKSVEVIKDIADGAANVVEQLAASHLPSGTVEQASAVSLPLPDDSVAAVITDPPYYDSIPYANLSDFFYVWLRRMLSADHPQLFAESETPKANEIVQLAERNAMYAHKTKEFFEEQMILALTEARRVVEPTGLACVVFAHKTTSGWEALLNAVLSAGWIVTASWPIDTELATRFKAIGTASLNSSVHLVCRPREALGGGLVRESIGDWREVLRLLPDRIHEWMPRLAREGVVGADAIFACLGPALEVFSSYSRVERTNGDVVGLREYLEHVWAAVSQEALSMIFADADTAGLDEDARVTAMWLWTLAAPSGEAGLKDEDDEAIAEGDEDSEGESSSAQSAKRYVLEFDAARKIAQGLGARLEALGHVVEINGDTARLLAVAERTKYLFGGVADVHAASKSPKKQRQRTLFEELEEVAEQQGWGEVGVPRAGSTTLDRVHQAMILFGAGRGEALKRFIVDEGVGRGAQFWKLAQALSALYFRGTDEKRWVDGVLARKKGLGF